MNKKSAMGHNPLGYRPLAEAKFDFIPQTDAGSGKETTPSNLSGKKTVSYYLETEVIEQVKRIAKEHEDSFSHTANELLKEAIKLESLE